MAFSQVIGYNRYLIISLMSSRGPVAMPTIREIAETCGTTKQTVTARLKELGLWEGHVSKSGRAFEVDDYAASAVSDALKDAARERERAEKATKQDVGAEAAIVAVEALKTALSASQEQSQALARELDAKNEQIRSLMAELSAARETIDRLSRRSWLDRLLGRGLPPAGGTTS